MNFEELSLKFLGIPSLEAFEKLKAASPESYQTAEDLVEGIPAQLLIISPLLISENYANQLTDQFPFPLHPEFVELLHQIVSEHFSWLPSHPFHFAAAQLIFKSRSEQNEEQRNLPCRSIHSASCSPMLSGLNPPFLPLVRVKVDDAEDQPVISDLFNWPDMLFFASILLGSVGSHCEATASLNRDSKIVLLAPPERIQELVEQSRKSLDLIETHLGSKDKTNTDT